MKITVENLFKKAGVEWRELSFNESIDIRKKDIFIKSLNLNTGEPEFRKVLYLIRKEDCFVYRIKDQNGNEVFKASPNHKVFSKKENSWGFYHLCSLDKKFISLNDKGDILNLKYEVTNESFPILDFSVEENENYFANGVLSHNTTPGGKAMKFYSSIRLDMRKREYIMEKENPIGLRITLKVVKNKTAPPMKRYLLDLDFKRGFDSTMEWIDFAIETEVIKQKGPWYYLPNGDKLQGKLKIIDLFSKGKNQELYQEIIEETKKRKFTESSSGIEYIDEVEEIEEEEKSEGGEETSVEEVMEERQPAE